MTINQVLVPSNTLTDPVNRVGSSSGGNKEGHNHSNKKDKNKEVKITKKKEGWTHNLTQ